MLKEARLLDGVDVTMYINLWKNLTGITEEELDWRPRPLDTGHMVWNEERA